MQMRGQGQGVEDEEGGGGLCAPCSLLDENWACSRSPAHHARQRLLGILNLLPLVHITLLDRARVRPTDFEQLFLHVYRLHVL